MVVPGQLAADWWLMVVAMMTPLTALQVAHVRRSSLSGRRAAAMAAFLGAYWTTWFVTILFLFPLALALSSAVGDKADLPAALLLALIVSASPAAQRARNRCHRTGRIAAFGAWALAGCARQGLTTGASCVAACWPWMLVPTTVQSLHLTPMILVGAYLFADRIAPAAPPAWRLPPAWETLFGPLLTGSARRLAVGAAPRQGAGADFANDAYPGIESIRRRVYGCFGWLMTASVGPSSTISPR